MPGSQHLQSSCHPQSLPSPTEASPLLALLTFKHNPVFQVWESAFPVLSHLRASFRRAILREDTSLAQQTLFSNFSIRSLYVNFLFFFFFIACDFEFSFFFLFYSLLFYLKNLIYLFCYFSYELNAVLYSTYCWIFVKNFTLWGIP